MQGHSKLTYRPTFKVRPAPDGFYVVDCRTQESSVGSRQSSGGKVVAWFATSEEAAREARARSVDSGQSSVVSEGDGGMKVQTYRDLVAWQKARALVTAVYEASASWPRAEVYGLTDQARRAAVSIPANIAEGQGRQGKAEFLHHLSMANGSLHELETHLYIASDLGYLAPSACDALLEQTAEVGRLINGLMRSLR